MIPEAREVHLSRKDRKVLEGCCRSPVTLQRDLKRARIVLLAADGRSTRSIAKEVGVQPRIVSLWRHRYADHGLEGLQDKPRPGKQPIYTKTTDKRILKLLDKPPPQGFARWTGPLLAEALGDVDVQYVWRFLRSHKIDLVVRKSWCESNDPNFTAKAADVVGLYVAPPNKAIVLCVDEKPSIQALERAQGYLKLPNGRALTGQSHDYKRHGTTTLFAALEVATGKIIATHSKRRRRVEFLDFMNSVTAAFPDRKLHVILDNLNTHKKNEPWLKAHPNVQFHFTPTSASWLNQVKTLMRRMGIETLYRRPRTTKPEPGHKIYPYLLRGMEITRPNQVWAMDITYIPMAHGFVYLAVVLDWATRRVLSWRLSITMEAAFCVETLEDALARHGKPEIFNTDQGSQFTGAAFTSALASNGIAISMDGKGAWRDNVFVERLWRSVKYEEVYLRAYETVGEARASIGRYFDFYNGRRPHSSLDDATPDQAYFNQPPFRLAA